MGRLAGRLSRIKHNQENVKKVIPPVGENKLDLPGWEEITPFVWKKEQVYHDISLPTASYLLEHKTGRPYSLSDLVFYDTETTGLSTGAGTYVFLTGWGFFKGDSFRLIQLFMADYPGETDYLEVIRKAFSEEKIFVSYNGRAYDKHVLDTRFLMNRMKCGWKYQYDLLYPSRALWKGVFSDCRLGTLEEKILGETRELDISGAEIPRIWLNFVKTGIQKRLENVFSHHAHDIRTLALLFGKIAEIETGGYETLNESQGNAPGWGSYLYRQGLSEKAAEIWKDAFEQRGERKAGFYLAEHFKRTGNWEEAETLWLALNSNLSLRAGTELAKYWEHRKKDIPAALNLTEKMLRLPLTPENRQLLQHRYKRLKRKRDV